IRKSATRVTSFPVTHTGLPWVGAARGGVRPRGLQSKVGKKKGPALPCGEVDEPAIAGGTAQKSRVSGFLATEACTPRGVATHLGDTLAQPSLPPSRAKQGTQNPSAILR